MGTRQIWLETVDSTNRVAWRLWEGGCRERLWVAARRQEAGVGRRGTPWASPPGGLWASLLLPFSPPLAPRPSAWLGLVTALAVVRTVERVARVAARVKWPNDVVVRGRKLAGVLAETRGIAGETRVAVIGVGLDAEVPVSSLPENVRPTATSLLEETGEKFSPRALLPVLDRTLQPMISLLRSGAYRLVAEEVRQYLEFLGQPAMVEAEGSRYEGYFAGIDDEGRLVLATLGRSVAFDPAKAHLLFPVPPPGHGPCGDGSGIAGIPRGKGIRRGSGS
ncbi:MAG TPA: biotin--[acetyl-CoA-carboxylase] ligase [Firmicutes bacterium]|nr:biotin--[acetyl-CoA-carboxylase] ligase [Bacillota bacterium]